MSARRRSVAALMVVTGLTLGESAHGQAQAVAAAPAQPGRTVSTTDSDVVDETLVILVDKWTDSGKTKNVGLNVTYVWGSLAERKADVVDAGDRWRVRFADRPAPDVAGTITYTYLFEVDDATRAKVSAALQKLVESAIGMAGDAPAEPAKRTEFYVDEYPKRLATTVAELDGYRTPEGEKMGVATLKAYGFETKDAAWVPTADTFVKLGVDEQNFIVGRTAKKNYDGSIASRPDRAELPTKGPKCVGAFALNADVDLAGSLPDLEAVANDCVNVLSDNKVDVSGLPAALKSLFGEVGDVVGLTEAINDVRLHLPKLDDPKDDAAKKAYPTSQAALHALRVATELRTRVAAKKLADAAIARKLPELLRRAEELKSRRTGADILKQDARRRMYDIATGFVFVGGVEDFAFVNVIALCPGGCLKTDAGTAEYGLNRHTFSIDVGFGVTGAFDTADPRTDGAFGIVTGVSWNPIDVLRLSGGLFAFENQQNQKLNAMPYVGATVNVIHTATLVGIMKKPDLPKPDLGPQTAK